MGGSAAASQAAPFADMTLRQASEKGEKPGEITPARALVTVASDKNDVSTSLVGTACRCRTLGNPGTPSPGRKQSTHTKQLQSGTGKRSGEHVALSKWSRATALFEM
jgi:hypothetical protein